MGTTKNLLNLILVFGLVLIVRQLNPKLFIMARASQDSVKSKLRAAGADKVESPYETGAHNMAMRVLRPTVTNFLDLALARKNEHSDG